MSFANACGNRFRVAFLLAVLLLAGCTGNAERTRILKEVDSLRERTRALNRLVAERDAIIVDRDRQIGALTQFSPDRPADLFAPIALEIASLSRGRDYDGIAGDDGITVHLRPKDADGDAVKSPGTIRVQLVDNSELGMPRVIGVFAFEDPDQLRSLWHNKFGTQHYSLRCPFPADALLAESRSLTVTAEFVDFLTGRTLRATKDVAISPPRH
jgi:hypothetical protein